MYTLAVKDFVMIAHSLRGEAFGPAQQVHGATLAITAELKTKTLSELDIVIDIGVFRDTLRAVLKAIDYQNLDGHPAFERRRSTTERIVEHVHHELAKALSGVPKDSVLRVVADETPVAWVAFEQVIGG
jgi:6-pyruvoyltetrahydropterin/6-carboxytetrahydropterin synthase